MQFECRLRVLNRRIFFGGLDDIPEEWENEYKKLIKSGKTKIKCKTTISIPVGAPKDMIEEWLEFQLIGGDYDVGTPIRRAMLNIMPEIISIDYE